MTYNIVALPGDGIGPEILNGTLKLLQYISHKYQFDYQVTKHHFGGASIDHYHVPLTENLKHAKTADAILLGAIGGPKWNDPNNRPEQGLLTLKKVFRFICKHTPNESNFRYESIFTTKSGPCRRNRFGYCT